VHVISLKKQRDLMAENVVDKFDIYTVGVNDFSFIIAEKTECVNR